MLGAGHTGMNKTWLLSHRAPGQKRQQTVLKKAEGAKDTGQGRGQDRFPEDTTSELTCEEQRGAIEMGTWPWRRVVGQGLLSRETAQAKISVDSRAQRITSTSVWVG